MTELSFSLPRHFTGRFISDEQLEIGEKEHLLLKAYVPGIEFVYGTDVFDITVCYKNSDTPRMMVSDKTITIHDHWHGHISPDLYHVLARVSRQHYLHNNLFPVHSACVGRDNLVLLIGHSGTGKTTIALKLLEEGMKLFSGNKTVVEFGDDHTLEAIAGTKTITARTNAITHQGSSITYFDRTAFALKEYQYRQGGPITSVVLVRLNDWKGDWKQLEAASALHTLYPYFLDTVDSDVIVGTDVLDGSVGKETKEYLVQRLKRVVEKVPVYSAVGSLSFIVNKIFELQK